MNPGGHDEEWWVTCGCQCLHNDIRSKLTGYMMLHSLHWLGERNSIKTRQEWAWFSGHIEYLVCVCVCVFVCVCIDGGTVMGYCRVLQHWHACVARKMHKSCFTRPSNLRTVQRLWSPYWLRNCWFWLFADWLLVMFAGEVRITLWRLIGYSLVTHWWVHRNQSVTGLCSCRAMTERCFILSSNSWSSLWLVMLVLGLWLAGWV